MALQVSSVYGGCFWMIFRLANTEIRLKEEKRLCRKLNEILIDVLALIWICALFLLLLLALNFSDLNLNFVKSQHIISQSNEKLSLCF